MIASLHNFGSTEIDGDGSWPSSFPLLAGYFGAIGPLSEAELVLLRDLAADAHYHPPHRDICLPNRSPPPPRLLCSGWACRYRTLSNGRRQIIPILLPGAFIGPVM